MSRYIVNPVKGAKLAKWPSGGIYQLFGENGKLYSQAVCLQSCVIKECCLRAHNGLDYIGKEGTPIIATGGVIVDVKNDAGGYGKHIRILTDPDAEGTCYELTYGHLKDVFVPVGLRVKDGDAIGTMGNTGFIISGSTPYWGNAPAGKGVHLHFGTREVSLKQDTGFQSVYATGQRVLIKNYDNGFFGAIDPLPFIQVWIDEEKISILRRLVEAYQTLIQAIKGRSISFV